MRPCILLLLFLSLASGLQTETASTEYAQKTAQRLLTEVAKGQAKKSRLRLWE
jgi:hypothetical protein